jgi:hypothetical protein
VTFADGFPTGFDQLVSLTPLPIKFVSVTPNSGGSLGGTLVQVRAPGISEQTKGLNLFNASLSKNICTKVKYLEQDTFSCLTFAGPIALSDDIQLVWDLIALGTVEGTTTTTTNKVACSNSDTTKCKFSQDSASSPIITALTISGTQITFDGS